MYWPSFASGKTINFASGVWVGGKVNHIPYTACAEYESEWAPGMVLPSGVADNKDDPKYKLYKINKADALNPQGNPDWMNWPVDQGAPWVDANANGIYEPLSGDAPALMGDQMIYYTMNDLDVSKHSTFQSPPIGLQCKVTIWGYNRPDEFGDMMFAKFQLKNVKNLRVDSTYLGIWADIDIGGGNKDFVGCDTTLSLGYTYTEGTNAQYGVAGPAIGYDFFQGAIVKGAAGDSAKAFGKRFPGYKNLPMASFTKYYNTTTRTDPFGDPETAQEAWNLMSGIGRFGDKFVDKSTGKTVYPVRYAPGDPVTNTGWLDKQDHPSGDRRQLLCCGPFTLAPGDSQEVVTACIIAQGTDNLTSITRLKQADKKAQTAYDIDFSLPPAPVPPMVKASGLDRKIYLTWDGAAESYESTDQVDVDENGDPTYYTFQGYNIYQLETNQGLGAVKKIATFDVEDGVLDIRDFEFVGALGENVEHVVQKGSDSGIRRYFELKTDPLRGDAPLVNNRPYYFAITAYGYNSYGIPKILESPKQILVAYPQQPFGQKINGAYNDSLKVTHTGPSQGTVNAFIVDPAQVTGHNYKVTFKTKDGEAMWDLTDVTTNKVVLADQTNQAGPPYDIAQGMVVEVKGPAPGINFEAQDPALTPAGYETSCLGWGISTADNGNRWFTGYDVPTNIGVSPAAFFGGINNFYDYWGTSASRYTSVKLEFIKDPGADSSNWSKAYVSRRDLGYVLGPKIGWFPGKIWNTDVTPNERLAVAFVEDNRLAPANALWDMGWDKVTKTYANAGSQGNRELLYILDSKYDGATSMLKADWAGKNVGGMYQLFPAPRGTREWNAASFTMFLFASVPNGSTDAFTFSTSGKGAEASDAYSKEDVAKINVFPNPYFGANVEETRTLQHFVRFTHLPPTATLRVYTLAGELIRTLNHTDGTQFQEWNLENNYQIPVASGMYIVHVDCGNLGEKVLKMAVLMVEERLRQY